VNTSPIFFYKKAKTRESRKKAKDETQKGENYEKGERAQS